MQTTTPETGQLTIPEGLMRLPVARQIHEINFDLPNFVARAATGSGKTMIVPAYEALLRKGRGEKGCIAIRVPTKVVGGFVTSGLRMFWKDAGLKVGILNRDVTPKEEKFCSEADIVIISDGSLNRLMKLNNVHAFYADEAHWLSLNAELDIAIAKQKGIPVRLLSATIDEKPFIDYLGPGTGNYLLEGRTFPIRKHVIWASDAVFKRDALDELYSIIDQACASLNAAGESGIFFLPTRQMCEDAAAHFVKAIPTTFVHGGVSPAEAETWTTRHAGKPYLVFATTAAAVGITLDLHRAYIADEIIDSVVERGMKRMGSGKMDDNMLLQAAGRAGRIREGDAFIITHTDHRDPGFVWDEVRPRPIKPPAEKATPFEVIMAMAQHGITKDDELDLISNLDPEELRIAREWLQRNNCIDAEGNLTKLGKYVGAFPMATQQAHLILSHRCRPCAAGVYNEASRCPRCIKGRLTLLAGFTLGLQGTFGMLRIKPRSAALVDKRLGPVVKTKNGDSRDAAKSFPHFCLVPPDTLVMGSVPLSLAKLMQRIVKMEARDIKGWADENNFWAKSLFTARKDFTENASFVLNEGGLRAFKVVNLDDVELQRDVHEHLKRHPLYKPAAIYGATQDNRGMPGFFDSVYADCFDMDIIQRPWFAWSIPEMVRKPRFSFFSLTMGFVEPDGHAGFPEVPRLDQWLAARKKGPAAPALVTVPTGQAKLVVAPVKAGTVIGKPKAEAKPQFDEDGNPIGPAEEDDQEE